MDFISAAKNESQSEASAENHADARHHDREEGEASGRDAVDFACPVCGARQALSEACRNG